MTVLLLGLVTLLGAGWMARRAAPGRRAGLWVLALGVLAIGQIWVQRDRLASYQVRLLGQRFRPGDGGVVAVVSGDRDRADYHVPGAGNTPAAVLETVPDSTAARAAEPVAGGEVARAGPPVAGGVVARAGPPGAGSVAVTTTRSGWRGRVQVVLGSVAVAPGDRIRVRGESFVFERSRVSLLQRARLAGTRDALARGDDGDGASSKATLPYPEGAGVLGLLPKRPGIFRRTYPLAELAAASAAPGNAEVLASLKSFIYYDDRGEARLAVLDEGVDVVSALGASKAAVRAVPAWTGRGPAPVVTVAGLPYRDFPDPELAEGERYGVRPLRSFRVHADGEWVTVNGVRPEVHALEVAALPSARLAPAGLAPGDDDATLHPVRLAAGDAPAVPADLALASPSNSFAAAGQAVLRLPVSPARGWFELLAPSGLARWETGRPFTLTDGQRGLLLRVDGLAASPAFLLLLAALFLLAAVPFAVVETSGAVRGVALAAVGLAALRLLLSLSAKARYPFVDEGHQIGLWLIPALPWFVCALGRTRCGRGLVPAHRRLRSPSAPPLATGVRPRKARFRPSPSWAPTTVLAAALVILAAALFPRSPAKAGVLTAAVAGSAALALLPASVLLPAPVRWPRWKPLRGLVGGVPAPWTGVGLGFALFLGRVALDMAGFREQVPLGGTRVGLSVLYTPLAMGCFALVAAAHDRRISRAEPAERPRVARRALLDLSGLLAFAYAAASAWISDFGILFTTLPGPLLVMALASAWWGRRVGRSTALLGTLPLALFVAFQAAPGLLRPVLPGVGGPSSGLEAWSRNELLLLERDDPEALKLIGESRSEALAVMRETMRSYTRGNWSGQGFLSGRVSPQIRTTATREHVVTGLLASQWGAPGTLGLLAMLLAVFRPLLPAGRWSSPARVLAATALLSLSAAGVYMILANYGLALFTGKNVFLLGLDSLGDTLEAMALLGLAATALARTDAA